MKQRIITAVIAAAVFLPIVIYGKLPFVAFIYFLATVGLFEAMRMKRMSMASVPGVLSLFLLWFLMIPSNMFEADSLILTKMDFILLIALLLLSYTVLSKNRFTFDDVGFLLISTIYVGLGFYYFIEIRELALAFVFFALFVIWTTDSGAYFIGKSMGKTKLWPEISPNKTVEGSLGGVICAIVLALIFHFVVDFDHSLFITIIIASLLSIFGQIGDLVESALKRHYKIKDSGSILPGHGGILDRFDSLLFVLPLLHFIHIFLF
ncbi:MULTISPECIES: phosphatidate cytidylyltransferase [Bacillaceae]|uniref:Phosphatidate cytidylyltransferase n=1 Tax=Sutcliffiella horikoshii TaxID=79883 RepID=A0A5D4TB87_9BACI|nr:MULTISPECIES: phosphatidate cytidylyltransferase [Bacillaceae]TYS72877.1 phosphatidate cytidylyltransferase [Sutcliffiella horikoshii]